MKRFEGRNFELFRSYDPNLTSQYHGSKGESAYYELIIMEYKFTEPQYFIKYPYTDFFVELAGGGGSMRGVHKRITLTHPIKDIIDPYHYEGKLDNQKLELYQFGDRVMLEVKTFSHDFLDRVTDDIFSQEYVPIPDIRTIAYAIFCPTEKKYLILDQSAYNFQYETMRLFFGDIKNGMKICKINNFVRYRDGGTTLFEFDYEGKEYKFLSPSSLGKEVKPSIKLNELQVIELPNTEIDRFIRDLDILVLR
jgi:hypothetical protein